jgi:hypothetical protein
MKQAKKSIRGKAPLLLSALLGVGLTLVGVQAAFSKPAPSVAPDAPVLTDKPTDPTTNATNFFAWTGPPIAARYQCSLDNGAWFTCASPYKWVIPTTNYGQRQFSVRTVDAASNVSTTTSYRFNYEKKLATTGMPFIITGSASGLVLGQEVSVPVRISNPNPVAIYVKSLTMTVGDRDLNAPADSTDVCTRARDLAPTVQSNLSQDRLLEVPAHGSVTLPVDDKGITAPAIELLDLMNVNQDSCKDARFALSFSGEATN